MVVIKLTKSRCGVVGHARRPPPPREPRTCIVNGHARTRYARVQAALANFNLLACAPRKPCTLTHCPPSLHSLVPSAPANRRDPGAPPALGYPSTLRLAYGQIASQGCFFEEKGAYTGAVAVSMVESMGCDYVLAGHSERR